MCKVKSFRCLRNGKSQSRGNHQEGQEKKRNNDPKRPAIKNTKIPKFLLHNNLHSLEEDSGERQTLLFSFVVTCFNLLPFVLKVLPICYQKNFRSVTIQVKICKREIY